MQRGRTKNQINPVICSLQQEHLIEFTGCAAILFIEIVYT